VTGFFVVALDRADLRQPQSAVDRFEVSDVMIPTRDGTRLHTLIFTPRLRQGEPLPIILKRTP
jgi:predicted acyl esterase